MNRWESQIFEHYVETCDMQNALYVVAEAEGEQKTKDEAALFASVRFVSCDSIEMSNHAPVQFYKYKDCRGGT